MFDARRQCFGELGVEQPRGALGRVMARIDLARPLERGVARDGIEREPRLGDVDVEHAVAVVLELEPAELGELPVPDQLDPLELPAARLAAARPVQCDVAGQRLERGAGLLIGEAERPVPGLQLRDPRDEGLRERIVLETKLH